MKSNFKRELVKIQEELSNLQTDLQEWADDHNEDWEYTQAGQEAYEELSTLDYVMGEIQNLTKVEL